MAIKLRPRTLARPNITIAQEWLLLKFAGNYHLGINQGGKPIGVSALFNTSNAPEVVNHHTFRFLERKGWIYKHTNGVWYLTPAGLTIAQMFAPNT